MRYSKELLAAGLMTMTFAGCGGKAPATSTRVAQAHNQPSSYDISGINCDPGEAELQIYEASKQNADLTVKGLTAGEGRDIVTGLESAGPEIINPMVVMCDGAVKYILGIERGFSGHDTFEVTKARARYQSFSIVDIKHGWDPKPIPLSSLGHYLVTVTVHDKGPAPAGASGLTSLPPVEGYGVMP